MLNARSVTFMMVVAMLAAGCGKKDGGSAQGADPKAELAKAEKAVAGVNGLVPEALKGKLEFTAVLDAEKQYAVVRPKGWDQKGLPGRVTPPDAAGLGFMTALWTGSNCDGSCEKKDWAAVADKVDFAQLKGQSFTTVKDEKRDGGRLLVARSDDRAYVVWAQWKPDARRYFVCRATLDKEAAAALPAFEAACAALRVVSWD